MVPRAPKWAPCFDHPTELPWECATIAVPMNHFNLSDERSFTIALSKIPASKDKVKKGTVFTNPGGPGKHLSLLTRKSGPGLHRILQGEYDLVGFDPRGINLTSPAVSCFENQLEQYLFDLGSLSFNIPASLSLLRDGHLESQVAISRAGIEAVNRKCVEQVGEHLKYVSTADVIRDIHWMSRALDGDDAKINFFGTSYGTIVGQYLTMMTPPEKLGKVVIDGVVDAELWLEYGINIFKQGLDDNNKVFGAFAQSCLDVGEECALSKHFQTVDDILAAMDSLIDSLYLYPIPLDHPALPSLSFQAGNLRLAYNAMAYSITSWKAFAGHIEDALFKSNFSGLPVGQPINLTEAALKPAQSERAGSAIFCADAKQWDLPKLTPREWTKAAMWGLETYTSRVGEFLSALDHCDLWDIKFENRFVSHSFVSRLFTIRHRYDRGFKLENGTLETPILILSQLYDPVTPLVHATDALERFGDNSRLVVQSDGYGHCAIGQASLCTAKILRDYYVNGIVPAESYTRCQVDQKPFLPWNDTQAVLQHLDISATNIEDFAGAVSLLEGLAMMGEGMRDQRTRLGL
ncbi:hypothetical protein BT69DRAFT_1215933 [Atractiella rhizophila]|nr:hypothetical protein BT69DRAFT_1215933 [Atractiella rhizophila]